MRRTLLLVLLFFGFSSEVWGYEERIAYQPTGASYKHDYVLVDGWGYDSCENYTDEAGNSNYYLATIADSEENEWIHWLFSGHSDWYGLIYSTPTSSGDGFNTGSSYRNWADGQPDGQSDHATEQYIEDYNLEVNAIYIDHDGQWYDDVLAVMPSTLKHICESDYATPDYPAGGSWELPKNVTAFGADISMVEHRYPPEGYYVSGIECLITDAWYNTSDVVSTSCNPRNLEPDTTYFYQIRYVGKWGKSTYSYKNDMDCSSDYSTCFTTKKLYLPNMNSVTWSLQSYNNSSNNYFRVSATSSTEDYKYFTKFDAQYRAVGTSSWIGVAETSNSYMDISPTSEAPRFEVQIKGYNDTGWGNWSSSKYIYSVVDGDDVTWSITPDKRSASITLDSANGYNITLRDYQYKESSSSSWIGVDTNNETLVLATAP